MFFSDISRKLVFLCPSEAGMGVTPIHWREAAAASSSKPLNSVGLLHLQGGVS